MPSVLSAFSPRASAAAPANAFEALFPGSDYNRRQTQIDRMNERSRKAREARVVQLARSSGTRDVPLPATTPAAPITQANRIVQQVGAPSPATSTPAVSPSSPADSRPRWQQALQRILNRPVTTPVRPDFRPLGNALARPGSVASQVNLGQRGNRNASQQASFDFLSNYRF